MVKADVQNSLNSYTRRFGMPFDGLGFLEPKKRSHVLQAWFDPWRLSTYIADRIARLRKEALPPTSFCPDSSPELQILICARGLIEERKYWVQKQYETSDGRRCAVGAVRAAVWMLRLGGTSSDEAQTILLSVAMDLGFKDIESMNDGSSHRTVVKAFDVAIARARLPTATF